MSLRATSVPLLSNEYTTATIAVGGALALTTATAKTVTSISLPAGTYLVWGIVDFTLTTATSTEYRAGLSTATNTLPTQAGGSGLGTDGLSVFPLSTTTLSDTVTDTAGPTLFTIAATTTLYLVAQATFSAGTIAAYGTINALQLNLV